MPELLRGAGAAVQQALVSLPAVPCGAWRVLFRRTFKVRLRGGALTWRGAFTPMSIRVFRVVCASVRVRVRDYVK